MLALGKNKKTSLNFRHELKDKGEGEKTIPTADRINV